MTWLEMLSGGEALHANLKAGLLSYFSTVSLDLELIHLFEVGGNNESICRNLGAHVAPLGYDSLVARSGKLDP